ncbi:MAG: hypothetical protein A4E74_00131 [Syntrophus sp. PtaB.Bin075]|nr:MAG: hypothetical protein A4E74_00131 [Syntrophus sp. PtaB.Bin075]
MTPQRFQNIPQGFVKNLYHPLTGPHVPRLHPRHRAIFSNGLGEKGQLLHLFHGLIHQGPTPVRLLLGKPGQAKMLEHFIVLVVQFRLECFQEGGRQFKSSFRQPFRVFRTELVQQPLKTPRMDLRLPGFPMKNPTDMGIVHLFRFTVVMGNQLFFIFNVGFQQSRAAGGIKGIRSRHETWFAAQPTDDHAQPVHMPHLLPGAGKEAGAHGRILSLLVGVDQIADDGGVFVCEITIQHVDQFLAVHDNPPDQFAKERLPQPAVPE